MIVDVQASGHRAAMRIDVVRPRSSTDWARLADEWQTLEAAADGSFFQSWTWVGCRVHERFRDPWLLRASESGRVVGLALFNRVAPAHLGFTRLWLHETGQRVEDSVFIEHNGPLLARGHEDLLAPMLAAARSRGRLMLSGVDDALLRTARAAGPCRVLASRPAPFVRLNGASEATWLAGLGTATRYQLRRSRRRYEAAGQLMVRRATDAAEAAAFLAGLVALHQARWTARGQPGAFAAPEVMAFHHALIARGLPRGEVELLCISTPAPQIVGYLYNFHWRGRTYAYQGGFDYAAAAAHQAPGLTCHHLAIVEAIAQGREVYDFLAGESRYKSSLGSNAITLHWLELSPTGGGALVQLQSRIAAGIAACRRRINFLPRKFLLRKRYVAGSDGMAHATVQSSFAAAE